MTNEPISQPVDTLSGRRIWRGRLVLGGRPVVIELESSPQGLANCRLRLEEGECREELPDIAGPAPDLACPHLCAAASQMRQYFLGQRSSFDLPLSPERGTPFQRQVWQAASQIPFGQTRSYWWIAVRAGNPYATRAVGGALGSNPLPLFVPCHRVVRADGSLGGFTPDPDLKALLLGHEAEIFSSADDADDRR